MRSLTDSSQVNEEESGIGSSSYGFSDRVSPGLNPWSYFPELAVDPSEAQWRSSAMGSLQILSPIQREILADFPWLHQRRLVNPTTVAASSSKDESEIERTSTDQVAWAQSILELQACENSETPFNSESLSSSLSDGELQKGNGEDEPAGTSAESGKRKREDVKSDDQETKKPMNRPRKKGGAKRVREPRYAIRTRTDTEVMDDGYKWRKYGQKAVKNSPHLRNYYRCTTLNCPVRKRVERCFEDPTLVVTTYEGTHTHQSPSFLRGLPGYPGGLQALLATLSHHYTLAGNTALPLFNTPGHSNGSAGFTSDLYQAQVQSQGSIHENLSVLPAHEQLLRLGPSFSNVSGLSYNSLTNSYQLGGSQLSSAGPFPSQPPPFSRHPDYAEPGAALDENYRPFPCSQDSKDHGGLLEDMFRSTNPPISRA